jgi:putative membrane protein
VGSHVDKLMAEGGHRASLSDYLAAERTLLAWIRTGLALMGFGFVVARFGLFPAGTRGRAAGSLRARIRIIPLVRHGPDRTRRRRECFAGWHHLRLVRQLDLGEATRSSVSTQAVAIAFFLALVGLAMAIYLVSVRGSVRLKFAAAAPSVHLLAVKVENQHNALVLLPLFAPCSCARVPYPQCEHPAPPGLGAPLGP